MFLLVSAYVHVRVRMHACVIFLFDMDPCDLANKQINKNSGARTGKGSVVDDGQIGHQILTGHVSHSQIVSLRPMSLNKNTDSWSKSNLLRGCRIFLPF